MPLTPCAYAFPNSWAYICPVPSQHRQTSGEGLWANFISKNEGKGKNVFSSIKQIYLPATTSWGCAHGLAGPLLLPGSSRHCPATVATTISPVVSPELSAAWSRVLESQPNKSSPENVNEYTVDLAMLAKETSVFEPFGFPRRVLALFSCSPLEKSPRAEAVRIQLLTVFQQIPLTLWLLTPVHWKMGVCSQDYSAFSCYPQCPCKLNVQQQLST